MVNLWTSILPSSSSSKTVTNLWIATVALPIVSSADYSTAVSAPALVVGVQDILPLPVKVLGYTAT